jgi:putative phage-type endonuclease
MLTADQLTQRMKGIGGSDAAAVVGLSPFKTPYQLYLEKRGESPLTDEETLSMELGNILEEPVAQLYSKRTGRQLRRQPLASHASYPFMLATIDRQILKDPRGPGIYEGKTTNEFSGATIHTAADIPDHYYLQAQHYMAVYDYAWASFGILVGTSRFLWFDIDRNDDVIAELINRETEFWERVQAGNPPPVDGHPRTTELFKKLYPSDTGKVLTIEAPELIHHAASLAKVKADLKELEEMKDQYENALKSAIGDASKAILPGFGEITWKQASPSTKESLDLEKLKAEFPDAYAACFTHKTIPGSRRFLLKPTKEKA